MKTIEELLKEKNLTPEEERNLHELIEECKQREADIQKASEESQEALDRLGNTCLSMLNSLKELNESSQNLAVRIEGIASVLDPAPSKRILH
jgi:uncharacterized coiled-coil DUF342 family protein